MIAKMNAIQNQDRFLQQIAEKRLAAGRPLKILLFGSQAHGGADSESDFDFLIIEEFCKSRYKRAAKYRRTLKNMEFAKDIVVWTPQEIAERRHAPNAFISTVLREGRIIYENKA